ncbi:MAG: prepilin-type N-terminal cleavage/methylation domain-containing protein [Planctomycetes bacterium]|nr:prepilin-type N-terminal cleavage/methylation domain-containing protein [Planctomycetota bacterium]
MKLPTTRVLTLPARARRGFSLAELMVVIVIVALLATLVIQNAPRFLSSGNKTRLKSDINAIEQAITVYYMESGGRYPDSLEALVQPDANGDTYLNADKVPTDPWKNEYIYEPPSGGQKKPIIRSLGRDGSPGGEGDDLDVDNLMIRNGEY